MRATIGDVAQLSGVSIATVSRVVNDAGLVRPETEVRVRAAIAQLGYAPNRSARGLASGRIGNIGVVLLTPGDASREDVFFLEMLRGIQSAVEPAGFGLLVSVRPGGQSDRSVSLAGRVDGVVYVEGAQPGPPEAPLRPPGVPMVVLGPNDVGGDAWAVTADSRLSSEMATSHLLATGCRQCVLIGGTDANQTASRKREGYLVAHARAGVHPEPARQVMVQSLHSHEAGRVAVEDLIERGVAFDAIQASDDILALGAIAALQARGRRVPDDVAVVGYGDVEAARFASPPLTTVHVPFGRIGWLGGTLLLSAIGGGAPPPIQLRVETHLVVRASTGAISPTSDRSLRDTQGGRT